ncbi:DMT family transporter [Bacillus sp. Marseille-P3661]|uniref:DMT family transporter n=1 Tax=Bacillus sp. Marseille-P3661 TaxID=1936234 RepID=UPI000C828E7D|nr:DMT family transporter [Bacillus sp. Marseille-P3661]
MNWKSPYILLIIATMFWGGNFVIGKGFSETMPPFTLALIRWIFAFIFLYPFARKEFIQNKELWKREWKIIFWMSLTGVAGFNTLVYIAVHYTTSINAILVNSSTPAIIILLSFLFLKEGLQVRHFIGIAVSIIGVLWIVSRGSLETLLSLSINKGEIWMIIAVIIWSIYSIIVKKHNHKFPASGVFLVTILMAIVILLPFSAYEWLTNTSMYFSISGFAGFMYLGGCASVIAFICWNKAVVDLGPGIASPFLNLLPVFGSVFAIAFLGEELTSAQLIGGTIAITGVLITTGLFFKKPLSSRVNQHLGS